MPENKHLKFLLIVAYIIIGYFAVIKVLPQAIIIFLPFILAYIVSAITHPVVLFFRQRLKFSNLWASIVSLILVLCLVATILTYAINTIISELKSLSATLPGLLETLPDKFSTVSEQWAAINKGVSPQIAEMLDQALITLSGMSVSLLKPAGSWTLNLAGTIAKSLPSVMIFIFAFILACIFMTIGYDDIKKRITYMLPSKLRERISQIKGYSFTAVGKYLKGMGVILCITFTELLIGFSILRVQYAFILALLIAIFDALPILGIGGILIPWSLIALLIGQYRLGIALLILYGIITVIRQLIEPKIMSSSLGLNPLITLIGMYTGFRLFGVFGMILVPIVVLIFTYIYRAGDFGQLKTNKN